MDPDRFAADVPGDDPPADDDAPDDNPPADDDTPGDARVCVVATRPDTFERCREGLYPSPRSYDRTRAAFEYMAFYRTTPVSAITHYARVVDRVEQTRGEPGPMDESDWEALVDPFSAERVAVVFALDELLPLDSPIENDANGVRGAWYCTVDDLRAAETVSALSALSERAADES